MTTIEELNDFGQSVWVDNISRSMLTSGSLKSMINAGLRGLTSNPTIFNKAISAGNDYDESIALLCRDGLAVQDIYDALTVSDIQQAADMFSNVYEKTKGLDGYVSLEINPCLCDNARETIAEGRRLHQKVNRPNLMLKVPATPAAFPAIEELTGLGINVNVTLIFSVSQYLETVRSYVRGLQRLIDSGGDAAHVRSVASVFVSRIDTAVDRALDQMISKEKDAMRKESLTQLKGKAAVAYVSLIYKHYRDIFTTGRFQHFTEKGAHYQRVLWGSTSTKNPAYSDIKYVSELIARDTVNTVPEATFNAFLNHGEVVEALTDDISEPQRILKALKEAGIDMEEVCAGLLKDGISVFVDAYNELLGTINKKKTRISKK